MCIKCLILEKLGLRYFRLCLIFRKFKGKYEGGNMKKKMKKNEN